MNIDDEERTVVKAMPHEGDGGMITNKSPEDFSSGLRERWRPPTLPHCIAVPSAQAGLTSLFGMGRGGTPLQ